MNRCITYLLYRQREECFKIQYIFYLRIVFKIKKMGKRDKEKHYINVRSSIKYTEVKTHLGNAISHWIK